MKWENMLFNLAQIGLTVSLAALIPIILRRVLKKRYPARAMCLVWAVLALRLLVPVQLTLPEPPVQVTPRTNYVVHAVQPAPGAAQAGNMALQVIDPPETHWVTDEQAAYLGGQDENSVTTVDVGGLLTVLWGAGAALFLLWQAAGYLSFRRALRRAARPGGSKALADLFEQEKRALGVGRDFPLCITSAADCPMLAGFLKPALYLPDDTLAEDEAVFIFRHELTHYRHGDLWLKLVLVLARAVQWFNPLVHLMARFAQEDIELACDDAVAKDMDGAERRAYGETILRSAAMQTRRRALVSCFAGDKKTLMRRFEGLFDKRAKKRGVALVLAMAVVVASLGCAFSVGQSKAGLTNERIVQLGGQWMSGKYRDAEPWYNMLADDLAQKLYEQQKALGAEVGQTDGEALWSIGTSSPYVSRFTVIPDGENQQAVIVTEWAASGSVPTRQAERIHFAQVGDEWKVDRVEGNLYINDTPFVDTADSLEHFRLLYKNDLGLPDLLDGQGAAFDLSGLDLRDPAEAVKAIFRLGGNVGVNCAAAVDVNGDGQDDQCWCTLTFAPDGGTVNVLMASQFGQGWLPQDWTDESGKNARTAADLTGQLARAVAHKSGQYLYPILSAQKQGEFIEHQQNGAEEWYWKLGGSSPSYRDFAVVPGRTQDEYIAVFQKYGGGMTDYRSAYAVTVGQEDGRSVITDVRDCAQLDYTQSDLFKLYYSLAWPVPEEGAQDFNGYPLSYLSQPVSAAVTMLRIDPVNGAFNAGVTVKNEQSNTAIVRLDFADGSAAVELWMEKHGAYWRPVAMLADTQSGSFSGITATVGGVPLPVGETTERAMSAAAGDVPLLAGGDKIELLLDPAPAGEVTIEDAVVRADGTLQYDDKVTEQSSFSYTGGAASLSHTYTVAHNMAEYLSSTMSRYIYRGVTVRYTDRAGTPHTDAFVFRVPGSLNSVLDGTTYTNYTYGYMLELPECFRDNCYVDESQSAITFGMPYAVDPNEAETGGALMWLCVEPTAILLRNFGEDWQTNGPVPMKLLAERNGMSYYLTYSSDVQYDIHNAEITAKYQEMDKAARALTGEAFRFIGDESDQRAYTQNEKECLLTAFAAEYLAGKSLPGDYRIADYTVLPDADEMKATLICSIASTSDAFEHRRAETLWFDKTGAVVAPVRVGTAEDSANKGTTLEKFLLFYQHLGMPVYDADMVARLQFENRRVHPVTGENGPDLSSPEKGAMYAAGLSEAYGSFDGTAVYNPDDPCWVTFRFWDPDRPEEMKAGEGGSVRVQMRLVQVDGSLPGVWLPEDFIAFGADGAQAGGLGIQYSPYDAEVYAHAVDYYQYRDTADLIWYLDMGWADGAYTEGILYELEQRWQADPASVEDAVNAAGEATQALWQTHKQMLSTMFSEQEIEAAYQAVRDYAAANGFSVENLRFDPETERNWSMSIWRHGVLWDNAQNGLTLDDVITVKGDAKFGPGSWRDSAPGWSFTLYRENGKWVLEDGAFGY